MILLGAAAALLSIAGFFLDRTQFFRSYLFSFLFWIDLPLGALPMLMTYHLTGGTWGASSCRIMEALSDTIVWMVPLALPILIGMHYIYPWLDSSIALDPRLVHKHLYLNPTTFWIRAALYFVSWIGLNFFLQRWSIAEERGAPPEIRARLRSFSAAGLVLYAFTVTFAGIDWQMSVEPFWYSTIYGMVYNAGQVMGSYAFMAIVFSWLVRQKRYIGLFPEKTLLDIGNILLAIVMVWAYFSFMQYLIVWSGNLPHESVWFIHRNTGSWRAMSYFLGAFEFGAPFTLLLFRGVKRRAAGLAALCWLLLVVRVVDHYWMVMPGFFRDGIHVHWLDVTTLLALGCFWLAVFMRRLRRREVFAIYDRDWPIEGVVHAGP